ncbi:MAG: DNA mismatch repair endonuclease MutL [Pyrinomonadaceae bacterium]
MNRINILPDNLANQIAAGEVVERPASVIKELVENAIDAGARRLRIEIELGGRRLMRVVDDGSGMVRDDAILAFERHATSKIRTLEDLGMIATLGFRGEALASIASVAKVELVTKVEEDQAATRVLIEGGRLIDVKDAARDTGTTISVRDLFFNTPARRKFMRSEATENYHLAGIVTHYALAHPEIAFTMTNNGREVLSASPARDLRERAFQIFGSGILESLLPVSGGREYIAKVSGFVSAPRERRTNRDAQYFFVNQRFVRDKTIAGGLLEGYRSVLPHGVYPVAFLFVDVPVEEVDVNVHPAKTEVRFRRNEAVKDVIAEAIRSSLARAGIVPETATETLPPPVVALEEPPREEQIAIGFHAGAGQPESARADSSPPAPQTVPDVPSVPDVSSGWSGTERSAMNGFSMPDYSADFESAAQIRTSDAAEPLAIEMPPLNSAADLVKAAEVDAVASAKIRPIAQLHDSFIIAVDDEGLLLVDQHVAHERILFDKFRKKEFDRPIESQNLLLPETIDLTPAQAEAFRLVEDHLIDLGFGLMQLSGRTVAIKSVPTDVPPSEARNLFAEILDTVELEKRGTAKATLRDQIAASLACKAAVKINMKLTPEKMQWLIDRLLLTSSPTTCPHGRPVILRLSMKDIERGFHRT